jgi:hypothetical protein
LIKDQALIMYHSYKTWHKVWLDARLE